MQDNRKEGTTKNRVLKIIVPIILIVVIVGIWYFKNMDNAADTASEKKGEVISQITPEENSVTTSGADSEGDANSTELTDINLDFALHVTEALDLEQLKSYGLPILIDFGADSCIPCKEMAPVLEKLNEELQGKAIIKFVDVWKYRELSKGYPISVIPTQILFDKEGNPLTPTNPEASQMLMYESSSTKEHLFTTHEGGMTEEMILATLKEMGMEE